MGDRFLLSAEAELRSGVFAGHISFFKRINGELVWQDGDKNPFQGITFSASSVILLALLLRGVQFWGGSNYIGGSHFSWDQMPS